MTRRRAQRNPRLELDVQQAIRSRRLPSRAQVRKWAQAVLENDARITVRVVGRAEARNLNRSFRGKDYATNVLTFVMRDSPPYEGDLVLCAPVIAHEARQQGKRLLAHYAHLVVHGALHLQGYDHESNADAQIMETRESRILTELGYPDPYGKDEGGRRKAEGGRMKAEG
ncbi:MAG: rRNA maturation RNase YbeY [Betaproteobacteria bacterium RIFCSPLOWO2_02_64_14]|nr:MAG: rRNA maturation RNase YbeY [Betaproteobacteria bacterium RIFCSPLOWO2_02_64_14]